MEPVKHRGRTPLDKGYQCDCCGHTSPPQPDTGMLFLSLVRRRPLCALLTMFVCAMMVALVL